jgi:5-formyltetrahydrofolate cyclo-ligase
MNLTKYTFLYNYVPSLKDIIENKKLTIYQEKSLNIITKHYAQVPLENINKKVLRKKIKLLKSNILISDLKKRSFLLNEKVINSIEFKNAKTIFCYISFRDEIDTYRILDFCLKNGKILLVPKIESKKNMTASMIKNLDNLEKNNFGILEPKDCEVINKNDIDLAIVPALAYSPLGYRIGYGGGYYDVFLKDFKGFSIGMVLKELLIKGLIPEKNDIPVKKLFIQ